MTKSPNWLTRKTTNWKDCDAITIAEVKQKREKTRPMWNNKVTICCQTVGKLFKKGAIVMCMVIPAKGIPNNVKWHLLLPITQRYA